MTNGVLEAALRNELVRELEQLTRLADEGDEELGPLDGAARRSTYGGIVAGSCGTASAERGRALFAVPPVPVASLAAYVPDAADCPPCVDIEVIESLADKVSAGDRTWNGK